jgi:RimJ/RimL family protein N-acetyltransferase
MVPHKPAATTAPPRLTFGRFDEVFLERSWHWLHEPEVKWLTMSRDFNREEQVGWFHRLPARQDYLIWGISRDGVPIGALGLKHIAGIDAEYWGYIGEQGCWGAGLGREMMGFIFNEARKLGLKELHLKVHKQNLRAIRLYIRFGFKTVGETGEAINMRTSLQEESKNGPAAFSVERYTPEHKDGWNAFLDTAKNATFLFRREYMDYHQDRFEDHSLMVFQGGKLAALLPANRAADGTVISHQGLSYGGFVVSRSAPLQEVLASFHACLRHLHERQVATLRLKQIPTFYSPLPADEVAYALFLLEARLYRRDCAAVVVQADRLPFQERRRRQINKARRANLRIVTETNYLPFWERVLVPQLAAKHGVRPVHTIEEITLLASRLPENIRQFSVYCGDEIVAGTTIYETPSVAHAQYIAATDHGRKIGALDHLFNWLIDEHYRDKQFFDFGICNEKEGRFLNHGLMDWKEGFGARTYAHDFYEIVTANHAKLESVLPTTSSSVV